MRGGRYLYAQSERRNGLLAIKNIVADTSHPLPLAEVTKLSGYMRTCGYMSKLTCNRRYRDGVTCVCVWECERASYHAAVAVW